MRGGHEESRRAGREFLGFIAWIILCIFCMATLVVLLEPWFMGEYSWQKVTRICSEMHAQVGGSNRPHLRCVARTVK